MLIIPAIYLSQGRSVLTIRGEAGMERAYDLAPERLARVWRGENAKSLHVVDLDNVRKGAKPDLETLAKIVSAVDIPVQFMGGDLTPEERRTVLQESGAYRLVLSEQQTRQPGCVAECLEALGPRKVVGALRLCLCGDSACPDSDLDELVATIRDVRDLGLERILLSIGEPGEPTTIREVVRELDVLVFLAEATRIRMTLHGWVGEYSGLEILQHMNLRTVDSLILDRPLYDNHFACQAIWRTEEKKMHQRGAFP